MRNNDNKINEVKKSSFYVNIRPKLEATLTALISIALIFFSTFLAYDKSIKSLKKEIKIGLQSNVMAAATTINGDLHPLFEEKTMSRSDSLYKSQNEPLELIRDKSIDIKYIYTNILREDKVYFILNPSPQDDGSPPPALMDPYVDYSSALLKALKEQKSTVSDIYEDEWGSFISAYAPFYNSKGEFVGTLGMDLELDNFYKRLEPINIAFEKTLIIIIFIGLIIGLFIWYIRRHSKSLLQNRKYNKMKLREINNDLKKSYMENITLLTKIEMTLRDSRLSNKVLPERFYSWVKHVVQYQNSKVDFEKPDFVDFDLFNFIQGVQENVEGINIEIYNEVESTLRVCGAPMPLYIDAITTFIHFIEKSIEQKNLEIRISQIDEGIHDVTLQIILRINIERDFNSRLSMALNPKIESSITNFNNHSFKVFIAAKELSQYQCKIENLNDANHSGLRIEMKLFKSKEN